MYPFCSLVSILALDTSASGHRLLFNGFESQMDFCLVTRKLPRQWLFLSSKSVGSMLLKAEH
eukprot:c36026_g1_i1 orf=33-218(-)